MRRSVARTGSVVAGLLAIGLCTGTARAGVSLGADMNIGVVMNGARPLSSVGSGIGGRLGYRANVGIFWITPEVGGSVFRLNEVDSPIRGVVGGSVGLRGVLQPSVFAHYGYAYVNPSLGGRTFDLGGALDLSVSVVRVGVRAGYVVVQPPAPVGILVSPAPLEWVELGLRAGLAF
jgi:hypothetical protein